MVTQRKYSVGMKSAVENKNLKCFESSLSVMCADRVEDKDADIK